MGGFHIHVNHRFLSLASCGTSLCPQSPVDWLLLPLRRRALRERVGDPQVTTDLRFVLRPSVRRFSFPTSWLWCRL